MSTQFKYLILNSTKYVQKQTKHTLKCDICYLQKYKIWLTGIFKQEDMKIEIV